MWPFKNVEPFWEDRFNELSIFNAEKARGLVHTKEMCNRMEKLQKDYDNKVKERFKTKTNENNP